MPQSCCAPLTFPARAERLIQQLDDLAARSDSELTEVALLSSRGLIYSWQEKKLENLRFSLAYGEPYGLLTVTEDTDDAVHVQIMPFPDDDGCTTYAQLCLIEKIDDLLEIVQCGIEDQITADFSRTETADRNAHRKKAPSDFVSQIL